MNFEPYLNLTQLQDALADVLPFRPARRTLYLWMNHGMPWVKPSGSSRRLFRISEVMAWIEAGRCNREPKQRGH